MSKGTFRKPGAAAGLTWVPKMRAVLTMSACPKAMPATLKRQSYGIKPITDGVVADQQQVADTFFALGLLPKPIKISDVARRSGS